MLYLALVAVAAVVIILCLAFYGWYRHLRDDEDDHV